MPRMTQANPAHRSLPATELRRLLASARAMVLEVAPAVERQRGRPVPMHRKGPGDYVTARDLAIERRLRRAVRSQHPGHGWLGEETGAHATAAEFVWLCDPIDGTSNFARGLAPHAIALACLHRGMPVAAAAFCMPERALYSAAAGLGAWRDRRRLRLRAKALGPASIVGVQWLRSARSFAMLERLSPTGARMRNFGCTVVQLCDVATGRLDANVQEQGRIWDLAAAALIVLEAGGRFTAWDGRPLLPFRDLSGARHHPSLAAAPRAHAQLVRRLRTPGLVVAPA